MYIFLLQFYLISHRKFILFFIIIVFGRSLSRFVHSSKFILNFVFQSSKARSGCAGHCRCRRTKRFQQLSRRIVLIIVTSCCASVHSVVSESLTQIPLNAGVTSRAMEKLLFAAPRDLIGLLTMFLSIPEILVPPVRCICAGSGQETEEKEVSSRIVHCGLEV